MNGVSYLALGIGLLTETTFVLGQVAGQMTVGQVTGSVPSAGVLITPPPAPVPVPSSGVLATVERHAVTLPLKTTQKFQITKRPGTTRRHVMHRAQPSEAR
jgi:hypothetical protein